MPALATKVVMQGGMPSPRGLPSRTGVVCPMKCAVEACDTYLHTQKKDLFWAWSRGLASGRARGVLGVWGVYVGRVSRMGADSARLPCF